MLSQKLKIIVRTLQDRFGLRFYGKQKSYTISYSIHLENISNNKESFHLIAPLAEDKEYQTIKNVSYSLTPESTQTDVVFQNKYNLWNISLEAQQKEILTIEYKATIKPRKVEYAPFEIEDYTKNVYKKYHQYNKENTYIIINEKIKNIAQNILNKTTNVHQIIFYCNQHVLNTLEYGNPINGLYNSEDASSQDCTDCGGYDTYLISLLNACGIPARIVAGFWVGHKNIQNSMHAWVEALLPNETWIPLDPSSEQLFQQGRSWTSGRFGFVGSDRIAMSHGCEIPLTVNTTHIETDILQHPIVIHKNSGTIKAKLHFSYS